MPQSSPGNGPSEIPSPAARGSSGCLFLFVLPFCVSGLLCLFLAAKHLLGGGPDWNQVAALAVGGIIVAGVGIGLLYRGLVAQRQRLLLEQLRARFPDCPWLWRPDWAEGRVGSASRSASAGSWFVALLLALLGAWTIFPVREALAGKENKLVLLVLAFPLVGLYLLYLAGKATLRRMKFGRSFFELETVPGVLGGRLAGAIRTSKKIDSPDGHQLTLSCVERCASDGDSPSNIEKVLWQEEAEVRGEESWETRDDPGSSIPVSFHVPPSLRPSDLSSAKSITWRLRVRSRVAGIDYEDVFEVPVFKTALSGDHAEHFPPENEARPASEWVETARRAGIEVNSLPDGGKEIFFAPGTSPGAALKTTLFTLVWTGALWLQIELGAPFIFPLLTGLIEILLVYVCLDLWTGCLRVRADGNGIRMESRILGLASERFVACQDIAAVRARIGMQIGESVYYDLEVVLAPGEKAEPGRLRPRKLIAGKGIRQKRLAEWLASSLEEASGVRQPVASATAR
jgi:hypothetical protein